MPIRKLVREIPITNPAKAIHLLLLLRQRLSPASSEKERRTSPVFLPSGEYTRVSPPPKTQLTRSKHFLYSTLPILFTPAGGEYYFLITRNRRGPSSAAPTSPARGRAPTENFHPPRPSSKSRPASFHWHDKNRPRARRSPALEGNQFLASDRAPPTRPPHFFNIRSEPSQ